MLACAGLCFRTHSSAGVHTACRGEAAFFGVPHVVGHRRRGQPLRSSPSTVKLTMRVVKPGWRQTWCTMQSGRTPGASSLGATGLLLYQEGHEHCNMVVEPGVGCMAGGQGGGLFGCTLFVSWARVSATITLAPQWWISRDAGCACCLSPWLTLVGSTTSMSSTTGFQTR
jgi:hypothetical protein